MGHCVTMRQMPVVLRVYATLHNFAPVQIFRIFWRWKQLSATKFQTETLWTGKPLFFLGGGHAIALKTSHFQENLQVLFFLTDFDSFLYIPFRYQVQWTDDTMLFHKTPSVNTRELAVKLLNFVLTKVWVFAQTHGGGLSKFCKYVDWQLCLKDKGQGSGIGGDFPCASVWIIQP